MNTFYLLASVESKMIATPFIDVSEDEQMEMNEDRTPIWAVSLVFFSTFVYLTWVSITAVV